MFVFCENIFTKILYYVKKIKYSIKKPLLLNHQIFFQSMIFIDMIDKKLSYISDTDRDRILEMHIVSTKNLYLNEQPFNSAGEPLMTYNQYRDYSEPSEPDTDDYQDDPPIDVRSELMKELTKNGIILSHMSDRSWEVDTWVDEFYFLIEFLGSDQIEIFKNHNGILENKLFEENQFDDAVAYILRHKPFFIRPNLDQTKKSKNESLSTSSKNYLNIILKEYYDRNKLYLREPLIEKLLRKDKRGKFIAPREIRSYVNNLPEIPCTDFDGNETVCTKIPEVLYIYITGRY